MKKFTKKIVVGVTLLTAVQTMSALAAVDNNIEFSITVGSYQTNGYSSSEHRDTTNLKNTWKVNFRKTSELKGDVTRFWLNTVNYIFNVPVSADHNVKAGSGAKYYVATSDKASDADVCLGAEDNNYNKSKYQVSGYWDEETGVIKK